MTLEIKDNVNKKPTMSERYYNEREAHLHSLIQYQLLKEKGIVINTVMHNDKANTDIQQRIFLLEKMFRYQENIVYIGIFACEYVINNDTLTFIFIKSKRPPLTDEQRKKAMEEIATWK
jgi:hypothetical protein